MHVEESKEDKEKRELRVYNAKIKMKAEAKQDVLGGSQGRLSLGDTDYVLCSVGHASNAAYMNLDAVTLKEVLENSFYELLHKAGYLIKDESVPEDDYIGIMVSPRKTIVVTGGGDLMPKELAEELHKFMQEKELLPETNGDHISIRDSLNTISALGLAMDTEGNYYSKYDLPDNFHTPYDLSFTNTFGIKHLPKGLTVDGTLTLADDTLSIEGDSKIKTLKLAEGGSLARLPDVAEEIVSDTMYAVTRIHNIDPKIALDKFVILQENLGKLTAEDILQAKKNWTELKSGKLPFKTKLAIKAKEGR